METSRFVPARISTPISRGFTLIIVVVLMTLAGCIKEGPVGPPGPPGGDNLSDPAILPRVIFTYPINNGAGPFNVFSTGNASQPHFIIRCNKYIRLSSLGDSSVLISGFDHPVKAILYREYYIREGASASSSNLFDDVLAFRVYDVGQFMYYGNSRYEVGARYTVTIKGPLVDINDNPLLQEHEFSFIPEPRFRVTSFSPDTSRPVTNPLREIQISFNGRIDTSIISRIHIAPAPPAGGWILGPYYVTDTTTVTYRSYDILPLSTEYTVTVDSSARDVKGHSLGLPFEARFRTTPFAVAQMYPADGSTGISTNSSITVNTNGEIDTATIRAAFSILPPVPGYISSSSGSISFYPYEEFNPGTRYTVSVSTELRTTDGAPLSAPFSATVTTQDMMVSYASPSDFSSGVGRNTWIYINCTAYLDTSTVQGSFTIEPAVAGRFFYDNMPTRGYHFVPAVPLNANTVYRITVATSLKSKSGPYLAREFKSSFKTGMY